MIPVKVQRTLMTNLTEKQQIISGPCCCPSLKDPVHLLKEELTQRPTKGGTPPPCLVTVAFRGLPGSAAVQEPGPHTPSQVLHKCTRRSPGALTSPAPSALWLSGPGHTCFSLHQAAPPPTCHTADKWERLESPPPPPRHRSHFPIGDVLLQMSPGCSATASHPPTP